MFPNKHKAALAIFASKPPPMSGDSGGDDNEGMDGGSDPMAGKMAAAQDFLDAIEAKDPHRLVQASEDMFRLCDSEPHEEGVHSEGGEDEGTPAMARGGMVGDPNVPRMPSWPRQAGERMGMGGGMKAAMPRWPMKAKPFRGG